MTAMPTLMVGYEYFPTAQSNDGIVRDTTGLSYWELTIEPPTLKQGTWIIAVVGSQDQLFNFTMQARYCDCPSCCSDHGACLPAFPADVCQCDAGYTGLPDCSAPVNSLSPESPITETVGSYSFHYIQIFISSKYLSTRVDLEVDAQKDTDATPTYNQLRLYASPQNLPTQADYWFASPLPMGASASLIIPHAELGTGNWYFGVFNSAPIPANVTMMGVLKGYCACGTAGHGSCNGPDHAICVCESGYLGSSCDVTESNSGVEVGTVVAVIILLFVVALVGGICAKPYIFKGETVYRVNE